MLIQDRIWGEFDIREKIILELLELPEIKRLAGISQFGLPYEYYGLKGFSRLEHSMGVMILLRRIGANLEEQVAGLTHDISHTAFSHLIDWVLGDKDKEDYQDKRHGIIMANGDIASFLKRNDFNPEKIANHHSYSLLEMPSPDICADRIDYAIREFQDWACQDIVEQCKNGLINYEGKIIFNDKKTAIKFAFGFLKLQREHWGAAEYNLRWQMFAQLLKYAIDKKYIDVDHFNGTDGEVINKLLGCRDNFVLERLGELRGRLKYEVVEGEHDYFVRKKFRHVDPLYLEEGVVKRLSVNDAKFSEFLRKEREYNEKGIKIVMHKA